jgi:glucoside 3-dehydrogenase (cytochrome c) hitch-hiker subunit
MGLSSVVEKKRANTCLTAPGAPRTLMRLKVDRSQPAEEVRISTDITRREALRRAAWLLGGTLSAPTIAAVLAGCGDRRGPAAAAWTPRTLTPEQSAVVVAIAEAIIPETDTPGARAAHVDQFIDALLTEHVSPAEKERFLSGLTRLDARTRRTHQKGFGELTASEQSTIIAELDGLAFGHEETLAQGAPPGTAPSPRAQESDVQVGQGVGATPAEAAMPQPDLADIGPRSFFRMMKELTVVGYYTSEVGQTQELRINPMKPYRDIPYVPGTPSWA